jgi:predicted dehydrogenase
MLSLGATLPFEMAIAKSENKVYKMGILGYGDRGSGLHRTLMDMPEQFKVTAICDNLPFRMDNAKKMFGNGLSYYNDYRQLLEKTDLDVILVATPLYLHLKHAKAVLESGKHLFQEKTMVFSVDEALQMAHLAKQYSNQIIQIGHQYRYSPLYFKVKEMIQSGYLGNVTQIEARWDRNNNWRREVPSPELERQINWRMYREYSGGLVAELLSHQIDFINWAFETTPTEIYGTGGIDTFKDGRETFDNVQVALRYGKEGMIGNFGATCGNQYDGYSFKIKGTKGMVALLTNEGIFYPEPDIRAELEQVDGVSGATKLVWSDGKKGVKIIDEKLKDGSVYALQDFYRCLVEKATPYSNVFNGGETAITVALANKSLYEGGRQLWEERYSLTNS